MKREKLPYEGSRLTPDQSRAGIDKLLATSSCKDFQWTVSNGEYILRFALPVKIKGVDRKIAFQFIPPRIPKQVRQYNTKTYKYEKIVVNDDITAFRVLFWYLKNKIVAVKTGLISAERELMANIIVKLPDGRVTTLGEKFEQELPALGSVEDLSSLPAPSEPKQEQRQGQPDKVIEAEYTESPPGGSS